MEEIKQVSDLVVGQTYVGHGGVELKYLGTNNYGGISFKPINGRGKYVLDSFGNVGFFPEFLGIGFRLFKK